MLLKRSGTQSINTELTEKLKVRTNTCSAVAFAFLAAIQRF